MELSANLMPDDIVGWVTLILGTVFLALSFWRNRRSDTIKDLETSNKTLRDLMTDQDKKIADMATKMEEVIKKTERQDEQIKALEQDRETFSGLIKTALIEYFKGHPLDAESLKTKITGVIDCGVSR